ncbi:ergothioneine biosynthesis protein EgtB [Vibrio sp. SM6]|uniref:Ergothioneine biosynthesis protein EgtB n=1 Tax=Vibrio agarilyticus TaxID=2726741 RepID=A0A7X8TNU3_9VIBR|nr:ergothioneine biosynthesis protein EgtB [Vibrio agarilyticus]NLS11985.1 ergothioneine biosynthesis protein EgtB [Vibrio agarilyticus]
MLLEHYLKTRHYTEALCAPLSTEDYVPQAEAFTSPPKWHLAHTTWFFECFVLKPYAKGYCEFDPTFDFLFNSYYRALGERAIRAQRGIITRPTVAEVYRYRQHVDRAIIQLLNDTPSIESALEDLITLGIHHEQQHQELLLSDLKYTFSLNPTHPVYHDGAVQVADTNSCSGWLSIAEGLYEIGHNDASFCYDNELGHHKVWLAPFSIAKDLVTNGEYIAFIEDGGYEHFQYWLDDGWSWVEQNHIRSPLYWQKINHQWHYYTLAGLKPLDPNAILTHISFYEASAFAHWKGLRLPTEFEWEVASQQLDWGKRWEWTSSAYLPYPGFRISAGAVGEYNGKFMINQMVLRGASVATSDGHQRYTYRNFFHPHFQWQFTGIRLVKENE